MAEESARPSWRKHFVQLAVGSVAFVLLFVVAIRVTVHEMFRGIASSRATGLSTTGWDTSQMWSTIGKSVAFSERSGTPWIARSADLRMHSSKFDHSVEQLHKITGSHRGYFEDLRTESRSGSGRALAATIAVPALEFDGTLAELRLVGRVESITQAGEDAAVKIATAARKLSAAQTNVARLQKLQRERRGELRDAVALEKDIAQANEEAVVAEREHESLLSTVAQPYIQVTVLEDFALRSNLVLPARCCRSAIPLSTEWPQSSRRLPHFSAFCSVTACPCCSGSVCCFCRFGPFIVGLASERRMHRRQPNPGTKGGRRYGVSGRRDFVLWRCRRATSGSFPFPAALRH